MKSRILLAILAFCMVVGMVSFTAFASTDMSASDFSVTGDAGSYRWNSTDEVLTITGSGELSIANIDPTTPTTNSIVVQNGVTANLTLNGVNIDVSSVTNACAFDIQGTATANITLQDTNTLRSGQNKAGLQVEGSATLNITSASSGSLFAVGGERAAGIGGGGQDSAGGIITISGGTVTATGGWHAAGIGGGSSGAGGTVKITGGTVTATGGGSGNLDDLGGRGIGGGQDVVTDDGTLEIMGGVVTATGGSGAPAFSAKPIISLQEDQMAKVAIMAGDASPGTAVFQSTDYHTNVYVKLAVLDVQQASITLDNTLTYYNGTPQTQSVQVAFGGSALVADTDYTVSGNTATNAGDHTLTITGNGNYIGTITRNYTIEKATLTITGATAQSKVYDGTTTATADVSFGGLANGETLVKDIDYTVGATLSSPDVGDNFTITGVVQLTNTALASNYIFSNAEFFFPTTASITPLSLTGAQVTLSVPLMANGTEQTQSVSSVVLNGKILKENIDYSISGNTATNAGTYTLTITGKGNYSGTATASFTVEQSIYTGSLDIADSKLPSGNSLQVNPQSEAERQSNLDKLTAYAKSNDIEGAVNFLEDITMVDANGNEVQPQNGDTRIRINVSGLTTKDTVTVLHIKDDGTVEEIRPVSVYDGYVEFDPPSFSVYSVVVHKAGTVVPSTTPETGDDFNPVLWISIAIISLGGALVFIRKKLVK